MSYNQIYDRGVCNKFNKIRTWDVTACNNMVTPNIDLDTINELPYPPTGLLPTPVANRVLVTDGSSVVEWGSVKPQNLTIGTADQILHTKSDASGVEWASNITVPGTLDVTGNAVFDVDLAVTNDLNVLNGDVTVATGDIDLTLGSITVDSGDIDVSTGDVRIVGDLALGGNLSFNAVSGTVGQVLTKTGATTQSFQDLSVGPADISPGLAYQTLRTDSTATAAEWSYDVYSNDLGVDGNLVFAMGPGTTADLLVKTSATTQQWAKPTPASLSQGVANQIMVTNSAGTAANWSSNVTVPGTLATTGTATTNGALNVAGNLQFAAVTGTVGQSIKKTGVSSQAWSDLGASDIKGGTVGQVLQSDGTNAVFNTDVSLPGNLAMVGVGAIASLPETRIYSTLKLGGDLAGSLGTVCVADASSVPHWEYPQYYAQYYQTAIQDMNGAATVLLMTTALVNVTNANISYLAGVFTLAEAGNYQIKFQTITSTSDAQTQVNFRINGLYLQSTPNIYIPALTQGQPLVLQGTFRLLAGSTVEIVSEPLVAGVINTSGLDSRGNATTIITIQRIGAYL